MQPTHLLRRNGALSFALVLAAFLPACDRTEKTDAHSSQPHSHAPGHDHAASPGEAAKYVCPMHPEVRQATAGKCPKCGMDLEPTSAATGAISAVATTAQPIRAGQKADATLVLKNPDGSAVTLDDLKEAHTEKIHVLIIDPTLMDYHHEHPVAGDRPGEYRFSFAPRTDGPYRIWADVVSAATGKQEYVVADLGGEFTGGEIPAPAQSLAATVDGLTYAVSFEGPLKAGEATLGILSVTDANGAVFQALEPIMGAYAHLVGFSDDRKTIAHIHPMGDEPKSAAERGAGRLQFHIEPERPGVLRLFAQVQIGGQSKFAMFTLNVDS